MAETAKKKTANGFILLNILVVIIIIVTGSQIRLLGTAGITAVFIVPFIVSTMLCPRCYKQFKENGTKRVPLRICRCVSVLTLLIMYISPIIGAGFTDSKAMYIPKRDVFVFGVRSSAANVLPRKLPKDASEYYFRTGLQTLAQNSHPYADLLFRCGTESIDSLISEAESRGMTKMSEGSPEGFSDFFGDEESEKEMTSQKEGLIWSTCKYLNIPNVTLDKLDNESIRHMAEHGICYGSGSQGCAFDRETGYAVYWG